MNKESKSNGVGFIGLLLIAFIVLKLCNVINWSWWWVLSPAWIPLALGVLGLIVYVALNNSKEDDKPEVPTETRWQQRLREMQERQKQSAKN